MVKGLRLKLMWGKPSEPRAAAVPPAFMPLHGGMPGFPGQAGLLPGPGVALPPPFFAAGGMGPPGLPGGLAMGAPRAYYPSMDPTAMGSVRAPVSESAE